MRISDRLRAWAKSIKREGVALWFAARDPRTPFWPKLLCAFVVAYALSPIDLIPDFIPVLGYVDDVLLLPALMWLAIRLMPPALMQENRLRADEWLQQGKEKPRSVIGAVAIVVVWLAVSAALWYGWAKVR
ncbi:YkvA family protein [Ramlibacter sp. WS9]|uniref:YkvA family protein n=1 Tax=Ramlibacter sp. WS9 TaxID=1882741 RepID=UPI0011416029|nr:YkvA family protein [Ramlibacter sp. WS9]ROZ74344.1 DUF1232 domain-containing protein [Ramlibacter sp. WS9]